MAQGVAHHFVGIYACGIKPKGMHSHIYQRLTIQHDAHVGISLNIMQQQVRMIEARLGDIDEDMNLFRNIEV